MSDFDAFATARLTFERLTEGHRTELRRFQTDPDVMRHIGGIRTPEQTEAYVERNLRHWEQYGYGIWVLREQGRSEMAGVGVLRHLLVDGQDEVETGYGFFPEYWGRGLATEVAVACLERGFDRVELDSIVAVTDPGNSASHHVLRKVGMAYERDFDNDGGRASLFRIHRRRQG
jgi:RimJ/RimL family protein N-acetyltransferase